MPGKNEKIPTPQKEKKTQHLSCISYLVSYLATTTLTIRAGVQGVKRTEAIPGHKQGPIHRIVA